MLLRLLLLLIYQKIPAVCIPFTLERQVGRFCHGNVGVRDGRQGISTCLVRLLPRLPRPLLRLPAASPAFLMHSITCRKKEGNCLQKKMSGKKLTLAAIAFVYVSPPRHEFQRATVYRRRAYKMCISRTNYNPSQWLFMNMNTRMEFLS